MKHRKSTRILSALLAFALALTLVPQLTLTAGAAGSFQDVPADAYFAEPVSWALSSGVTTGTDATHFSPNRTCTRAQVVTFLWRAAGCPEPGSRYDPFADVKEDQYYYKAVLWAVEAGVTTGTSADRFSPDAGCTRGQVVTFLWRALGRPAPGASENPFTDVGPSEYYSTAVGWAVENGVTTGASETRFDPNATCTRGQIVTFLHRTYVHPAAPIPAESKLVGVSMPTKSLMRWEQDGVNLREQLEAVGFEVDLQYAANDPAVQISQLENMIANGARVLIVAAVDGDALRAVLARAGKAGCTVIAYDRLIMGSGDVDYYVTFDNWAVGVAQGQYIADSLDLAHKSGPFNIEFITGDPNDPSVNFYFDGAMSILRPYLDSGKLVCRSGQTEKETVTTAGWSTENAQSRFEDLLSACYADEPLDAILASNDSTAEGVAAALANVYRNEVYPILTGQDCDIVAVRNILAGKQAMSVFKDTRDLVSKAAEMAVAVMKGGTPPVNDTETYDNGTGIVPSFLVAPRVCTRDNVRELLIDSGYYTGAMLGLDR